MNPRHRKTASLTLGFLTLGAHAAPLDTLDAAALAGYGAAGLRVSGRFPGDAWPSVEDDRSAFERIRAAAAGKGVRISSISGYYLSPQVEAAHLIANVEAARAVGAAMILQGCFEADHARVASLLRVYASAAADAGIRIALEFMPMSELKTIAEAQAVIAASGAANVGLLIDTLHLARSGATADDVAALDPATVYLTQLSDAPSKLATGSTLFDEAMSGRRHLGEGGLDLASVVNALPADAELELETPVVAQAALPPAARARHAAEAAQRFFDLHFSNATDDKGP
ncbi:Xylose isomerase-like TIM barrel [Variovorax sp. PBS-H4]|uniref:sugar phosphate isomerase/epimerase family protein n=1 Tax=Variovorax sp. PBS-H4 TaxID=434008 RepID=UPI0013174C65|nr:TIM barrel protein [Variovorax sp. PBS-H4]VTU34825.1 Xylose isomerase-like TIM barrel [Variovorax sp. PBS-H4]